MDIAGKRFRSRWQWMLLVIAFLASIGVIGVGAANWSRRRAASKPSLMDMTVPVQAKALSIRVEASGRVEPIETVNIGSEVSGRLIALYVDRGDRVKAGQVLARMRADEREATLAQAKEQLAEAEAEYTKLRNGSRREEIGRAKAQVASAQAQVDLRTKQLKRYRLLAREGAIAQQDLDEYIQAERSARASLHQAQQQLQEVTVGSRPEDLERAAAQVAAARAKIQEVQAQLDEATVRAPFDGIITEKYAHVGAIITPTMPAATTASATPSSIVELTSGLEILVDVPEANISQIKVGQPVKIVADSYPNRTFTGRVRQIDPKAVVEDNVTSFQVRVKLVTGHSDLISGMNVDATFTGKSIPDALMVPTVAVTNHDNQMGVLVAQEGKAKFQPVTVGMTQEGQTQILKGLRSGERVFIDFPEGQAPGTVGKPF